MEKIRICFTSTALNAYSETFIQNLKSGLDAQIFHCYGDAFPHLSEDKKLQSYKTPPLIDLIKKRTGLIKRPLKEHYLIRYIKSHRINLIFANYGPSGAVMAPIADELNIPLIVHFHGFDASIYEVLRKYHIAYQRMFSIARAIIVVSEEMKKDLIAIGAPVEKIFKMTYSPNPLFLKVTPDYHSNQVLAIGRFVEKKAPHLILLAFQKAKERCPDLCLKFVGSGELMTVCQDLSKALKISDVHFVGVLSPEEIATEMSKSFCFIQHSKQAANGDKEGTPVAILEAMAAGLPVISTIHAGIPEVVNDEINGHLVAEGDVEMMSRRLIELYMDRTLVMKLGQNGKHFIAINFSLENYQEKINVLIKEYLVNG
ncbi:glycosyltransferase [Algoriphagus sp. D3-2-R+10]|uniref:glycosyltransferase n=1 Tax=Algoriphagus aurantiacus TaxID=3103948 RepID=UPI002B3D3990|nr:glycosyltransferase [Algoriphagus sp. D3-2-R+10]MEB2778318.1 glycosyltransferase [Algoriphagus sp. D3-2-R+10]